MSVSFYIEFLPTGIYQFTCMPLATGEDVQYGPYPSYDEAFMAAGSHYSSCNDCQALGMPWVSQNVDVDEEVNMSNRNARLLLDALGLDDQDLCGSITGEELLQRALLAAAQERDESAIPDVVQINPAGGHFVNCGLPEGYVTMRLNELADLGREAHRLGRLIHWS